ncbi:MAG: hypothetical protein QOI58_3506 [Thermoanaerobaculia bacterium]|jgi:hypothetical protein|nr:hypothetical protein [Thermoanaerobaculia bacterium]
MTHAISSPETLSRTGTIDVLRQALAKLAADDVSICKLAAERNVFCHGLHRQSLSALRRDFDWINRKNPHISGSDLEEVVDRWQLARQEVTGLPTACDVQQFEHDGCNGWDDFSNEELSRFCLELMGRNVVVN